MDDVIFSDEEIRYYRALLAWEPSDNYDDDGPRERRKKKMPRPKEGPAGQFMFLILGSKGCGKTSILEKFCHGAFAKDAGREASPDGREKGCRRTMKIGDQVYVLSALELPARDLLNQERFRHAVEITEAAVLVYDVESRASFGLLQHVHDAIYDVVGDDPERGYGLSLVGNNSDCDEERRQVSWAEGRDLAASFRLGCAFLETSARTGDNVDKLFHMLGREVLKLRWFGRQRREHQGAETPGAVGKGPANVSPVRRMARWTSWTRPWLRRSLRDRKVSAPC
ncbi:P-loop containing nucleoside triphosphate hydrolase protein [Hypoxylon sp. NC1633]|nr:P-loop containing nucleoside triphosphate hydrolase protein [Hypoxylon sp. NC1633]